VDCKIAFRPSCCWRRVLEWLSHASDVYLYVYGQLLQVIGLWITYLPTVDYVRRWNDGVNTTYVHAGHWSAQWSFVYVFGRWCARVWTSNTDGNADVARSVVSLAVGINYRDAESSFFVGLWLRLRVKVGHRLLNLCDCDSVLSERLKK